MAGLQTDTANTGPGPEGLFALTGHLRHVLLAFLMVSSWELRGSDLTLSEMLHGNPWKQSTRS